MTEPAAAVPVSLTATPTVSLAALEALRALLAPVRAARLAAPRPGPEGGACP